MSTEQFDYVLGLVEPYILRLPTVYVAVYVQRRTMSYVTYDVARRRTWLYDVVRPRIYYVCRLMHTSNKMATDDDVYDVILASSSYLYASGEFYRFIIVEIDKLDLDASGFTTRCVVEMT